MTFRKCPLQSEESSEHSAMTSTTNLNLQSSSQTHRISHVPVHHCLPTPLPPAEPGEEPSVCHQNMSRSALTNDSPTKAGEHRLRLTSLFSTPTPIFSSAQKVPTNLSVNTTGYVRFGSSQRYTKCSSRAVLCTERSNMGWRTAQAPAGLDWLCDHRVCDLDKLPSLSELQLPCL